MGRYWYYGVIVAVVVAVIGVGIFFTFSTIVRPGYVGIKVSLYGEDKGVDDNVVGVGRQFLWFGQDIYKFPTFQQTKVWTRDETEGSPHDDSFTFQTKKGLSVNADIAVAYTIKADKVALLFQKYRQGVEEITNIHVRNVVRDALVAAASVRSVEDVYGEGKMDLLLDAVKRARSVLSPIGVEIDYISFINDLRLPDNVVRSINAKIESTQNAERLENELRATKAEAQKAKAKSEGDAIARTIAVENETKLTIMKSKADAEAKVIEAKAIAEANKLISNSLTDKLLEYQRNNKWDGVLPRFFGGEGTIPMLNLESK